MPPGWQPTVDGGDQVVAETSGNASGVGAQASAGVLVGRARELATITAAMAAARRGTARVVHLVGEPGIGKTALAEQAAALASGQGWVVAWGRAWDAAAAPPYWIWQQVLGSLVRVTDVSSRVGAATVAWLADVVPELAGAGEVPPVPAMGPDRSRVALQRAVVHVLGTAAADRPGGACHGGWVGAWAVRRRGWRGGGRWDLVAPVVRAPVLWVCACAAAGGRPCGGRGRCAAGAAPGGRGRAGGAAGSAWAAGRGRPPPSGGATGRRPAGHGRSDGGGRGRGLACLRP